jgi:hypothetical protein
MLLRRTWVVVGLVLVVVAGACGGGDDTSEPADSPTTTAAASGDDTPVTTADAPTTTAPAGGGGGGGGAGELKLGDETIALGTPRCFLQEQDAFGGGTILATAQASGVNAAGDDVLIDWTRFGDDTQFAGDDVLVNIGAEEYASKTDIGTLTLDGSTVTSPELTFTVFRDNDMIQIPGSFEINC